MQRRSRFTFHVSRLSAFTLIELLVVIAIIAILTAIVLPIASTLNDRANIATCESRLQQIHLALRQFYEDTGRYPESLNALVEKRYLDDAAVLLCSKTGRPFVYTASTPASDRKTIVACCASPRTQKGKRPHTFGEALVALRVGGGVATVRD